MPLALSLSLSNLFSARGLEVEPQTELFLVGEADESAALPGALQGGRHWVYG